MTPNVLFDCDGTLVLSEHKAFAGCCAVVNETLARKGVQPQYQFTPEQLMKRFVGKSFWGMITELAREHGFALEEEELKALVLEEENRVIEILAAEVEPASGVMNVLGELSGKTGMAVVSSSAMRRILACLQKADQERFFPADRVFSAASSLTVPTTKPDPAIYLHALRCLGLKASECVAVEDSRSGVTAAARAGIPVVGYVGSFPAHEKVEQTRVLKEAGAVVVIQHWDDFIPALVALGYCLTVG